MERRKNVLITGASGGIGRAMAEAFTEKGYGVAMACCAHPQRAQDVANRIGAQVFTCDITREEEVDALFSAAEEAYGFIDAVVNNAGVSWRGLLTDMTLEEWERVFAVNTRGVFLCCRRALPAMVRRKRGAILNISSMWGQQGASCEAAYSASKAAVIGLTQALAQEVGPSGIRVNCLCPGVIDTPMNASLTPGELGALAEETPLGRMGTPQEAAQAAVFLIENTFITGQSLGVNGGFLMR
ncbi:SDR family oxidoreductase [bacterium D16-76]|nr:SDR family oxidoreductase [bacterium D16-76]